MGGLSPVTSWHSSSETRYEGPRSYAIFVLLSCPDLNLAMAEPVPEPIWNWVSKAWRIMDDLAEKIDDLICVFEGGGDNTIDMLVMYTFAIIIALVITLALGKCIYSKFRSKGDKPSEVVEPLIVNKSEPSVENSAKPVAVAAATPVKDVKPAGGKYVPASPLTRKRLGSRSGRGISPGPVTRTRKGSGGLHPPPLATGPEAESVRWVNELFQWLYSDLVIVNELLNVWVTSLNEFTKQSVTEHGVGVEFVRVLSESPPPAISNVFCECAPNDDVTITCDCEATPWFQLKAFRQKGDKVEVSHYRLNVNRLRARLHILAISDKLTTDIKCDGWPEIKVALAQVGAIRSNLDETQLQDVICDIVTGALRHTAVHLNLGQYPTCPQLQRYQPSGRLLPLHYDSLMTPGGGMQQQYLRRLLVKVIKASGLGLSQGCSEPYCVVEVDEPPQKNQTSVKKGTNSPVWEEHFLFDVSNRTSEVLLEVYDRGGGETKFLGLGIVSMDELATSPSQRQVISLQATPEHENNPVSGTLTVEFLMIEGAEVPNLGDRPFKLKETLRSVSPSGGMVTTTKTVFSQPQERLINGGGNLTDSALRDLERNRGSTQASKSTLIIHSVQRETSQPEIVKVERLESGKWREVEKPTPGGQQMQPQSPLQQQILLQQQQMQQQQQLSQSPVLPSELDIIDRSRSRRKRDFFGSLRQRLSRSKGRSRSAGPVTDGIDPLANRSISADHNRDPSAHSIVPGLREDSARSSLSEASGISGASSRTYVSEASTLVLETIENGINKYYLVPLSLAQRGKWKKKGTKLHIYNDHTFVAKHLSGGTFCQVCKKMLARRLGKQGYECRDCHYKCHKHCHVKVETTCPTSNILNIELTSDAQSPYSIRKVLGPKKSE